MESLRHFSQSTFLIEEKEILYVDPYKIPEGLPQADIILITHTHFDHFSVEDLKKIAHKNTILIASTDVEKIECSYKELITMRPGEKRQCGMYTLEAVPAYNTDKEFHPKENNWLGFVVSYNNTKIYFAGDCDRMPEFSLLPSVDVACLPVSGTYVMTSEEASQAAVEDITASLFIPCHFGEVVGTEQDAQKFVEYVISHGKHAQIIKENGKSAE